MLDTGDATQPPVRLFGSGDVAALYERYAAGVHAFVYRRTGDSILADDITAETFVRVLQASIGRYEDRGLPVTAWLLRIATNAVVSHARRDHPWVTTDTLAVTELAVSADLGLRRSASGTNRYHRTARGYLHTCSACSPPTSGAPSCCAIGRSGPSRRSP